jgi:HD superfamily phosphohydrolase YqeK
MREMFAPTHPWSALMGNISKETVIAEMRNIFGIDEKRIKHALDVLSFAEEILLKEKGESDVVIAAAILHDIGIHEAERKYNSTAGLYQQIEGPPIAKRILKNLGAEDSVISEVCEIIARHHTPRPNETDNFKVLYDADTIVNLRDEFPNARKEELDAKINKFIFTAEARRLARKTLPK